MSVRRMFRLLVAAVIAAGSFPLASPAAGQAPETPPAVVTGVTVLVDGKPAPAAFRDLISIKPGDTYSRAVIDRVVKQTFRTGLFADIQVVRSGEPNAALTFLLARNLIVRRVYFTGSGIKSSRLREATETFRPGGVFAEDRVPKAIDELKEALRGEGYFDAVVRPSTRRDPGDAQVDVYFRISGWKRYRIQSVDITGPGSAKAADLKKRLKTRPGDFYAPSLLDKDIQTLETYYTSLGYPRSSVQLAAERFDEAGRGVRLELQADPREKVTIAVSGAKVPTSLLTPIWEERIFEEWGLAEGEVRILNYLRKQGYVFATVQSRIERPENELRISYAVAPGKKYRIEDFSFEGVKAFSPLRLKEELAVSERVLFFDLLSRDRLFAIPREIEYLYQANGYPDAKVDLELRRTENGNGIHVVYKVQEGLQRKIQSISFAGLRLFSAGALLKELVDVQGGPYFPPNVQRDAGILDNYYLNHGVRGTKIIPRVETGGNGLYDLKFEIEEGRVVTVKNILITGNKTTRASVIAKEIRIKKGAPADYSLIQETKQRLERLGIFSETRVEEIQTDADNETLVISVFEGEKNYVGAGIGFETVDAVNSLALWDSQYRVRGTGEYIRSNVLGLAAQLSLVGQYSLIEKRAIAAWNQPYLFGLPLQPSFLAWTEREDRISYTYDRRGFSFNTIRPLRRDLLLLTTLSWTRTVLTKLEIPESDVDRRFQPYSTALAAVSLIRDRRDDSLNPERGYFLSWVGQLASPVLGTESDYWKSFFKFQYFRSAFSRLHFGLTARLGLGHGKISIPERYFAGGANSFRGEDFDMLGPRDPEGHPLGGQALFLVNAEMGFPLISAIKDLSGVGFLDLGNVFAQVKDFRFTGLESAVGFGLRYKTPLGPVRFELAWKLGAPDAARGHKPLIFITLGNVF
ncbi:MAG: POTRA domain-containing protein [Candidatus Aminicenantales bacterium]